MKSVLSTGALVLGIILVAASLVWGILFPVGSGWTEEKSVRLREMRSRPELASMRVLQAGNRLSITPVTASEWQAVTALLDA